MRPIDKHPQDGPPREVYWGGEPAAESQYKDGKRHGPRKHYHKNGRMKATGEYVAGGLDGHWDEEAYDRGKKVGAGTMCDKSWTVKQTTAFGSKQGR